MHHSTIASVTASINYEFAEVLETLQPVPSWDVEDSFDPSPEDWADYAAWSRSLDGGCGVAELTPDEKDLICGSMTDREWREYCEAEYDSFADCEADRYVSDWS